MTRDDFIEKSFNCGCPNKIGLKNSCLKPSCIECWTEAVKDIKFKDDLELNKDLFEEKTVLTFKSGLDSIVGKPIKLLVNRRTKEYRYGLVKLFTSEDIQIECLNEILMLSADQLAELDPTILDYEKVED